MAILSIDYPALLGKLDELARKVGRASARPILLLYYVMVDEKTPRSDRMVILSAISYLILPVDLILARRLPFIGWIDETISLTVAYRKVCKYITPEIEKKADAVLDRWFLEYTNFVEVYE